MKNTARPLVFLAISLLLGSCVSTKQYKGLEYKMLELERQLEAMALLSEDTDLDGVPDALDQEPNTLPDAMVDTKGRTLDSDRDGVPDHLDREPFNPPRAGERVDEDGVVINPMAPAGGISEERVRELIEQAQLRDFNVGEGPDLGSLLYEFIYFDPNSTEIKVLEMAKLRKAADFMKNNPHLRFTINGYTDPYGNLNEKTLRRASYDRALEVARFLVNNCAIGRGRLLVRYFGGNDPVVPGQSDDRNHRRVEIRTAKPDELEMDPPGKN